MRMRPEYRIYPSLIDAFTQYERSDAIWEQYWGFSENPPHSPEEFRDLQFRTVIDRINRVPMAWEDSEAADRGTALNEVVDCMVEHRCSAKCDVQRVYGMRATGNAGSMSDACEVSGDVESAGEVVGLNVGYNKRVFYFPITLVRELAAYFKGMVAQQYIEAPLETSCGRVILYGFTDYIAPFAVHDLKTTGKYSVGKYRHNMQHLVYPYILHATGSGVRLFEYNVAECGRGGSWATYTETYTFDPGRDIPALTRRVEDFISFIEENRGLIRDKKIFNG